MQDLIDQIVKSDPRYPLEAYLFLREALDFTVKAMNKPTEGPGRHVSGQQLLEGIRRFALQEFGAMALRVLASWNIRSCEDFGNLVFNLVDRGVLGKTEEDSIDDFIGGYDFETAFKSPFLPGASMPPHLPHQTNHNN